MPSSDNFANLTENELAVRILAANGPQGPADAELRALSLQLAQKVSARPRPEALVQEIPSRDGDRKDYLVEFDNATRVRGTVRSRSTRRSGQAEVSAEVSCPSLGADKTPQQAREVAYSLLAAADECDRFLRSKL
jgi:hypothetical protein